MVCHPRSPPPFLGYTILKSFRGLMIVQNNSVFKVDVLSICLILDTPLLSTFSPEYINIRTLIKVETGFILINDVIKCFKKVWGIIIYEWRYSSKIANISHMRLTMFTQNLQYNKYLYLEN
jgi:hypothetical protein